MTDGERWASDALAELRDGGYSTAALGRFLLAAQRRSDDTRAARPELARQARSWMAAGALAWLVPAALGVEPLRSRMRAGLLWWAATAAMLDWHLGMLESEDGEPRPLGPADALTLARAWMVPLAADRPTPIMCAAAFASDALDGPLARASTPTRAGRDLEGLADAAFALAALRGAARNGLVGKFAVTAEAARLLSGAGATAHEYFVSARRPDPARSRAARSLAPVRAAALLAATLGHRRSADALMVAGAAASVALVAYRRPHA